MVSSVASGKCPKCEKIVVHANLDHITMGNQLTGPLYNAVSAVCPHCKNILGITIDPFVIRNEIVERVLDGLGVKKKAR
jgi:phage FluMu protein Com